jgi:hypothetical protein
MLAQIFGDATWQMRASERAALRGLLTELAPKLALEIGTAEGGSLRCIAAEASHVHAFDVVPPDKAIRGLSNVTFHTGDSHELLPRVLERLATEGAGVDFALVDGDHTADGVRRDVEDLLAAPAVSRTIILIHDTANQAVREGLEAIAYVDWPKATWVDLDWLPGYVARDTGVSWAGLGLIVVDALNGPRGAPARIADYAVPLPDVIGHQVFGSASRRLTRPLHAVKQAYLSLFRSR